MARIRTIKPDFWTDEKVVELSAFARLLFIGLWNFADDDGRMAYSPKKIKMQVFPADNLDVSELFGELRREKLIVVYSHNGEDYLAIRSFAKHQKIDKRTPSRLPPPPADEGSPQLPPTPAESPQPPPTEGKGRELEGNGKEVVVVASARSEFLRVGDLVLEAMRVDPSRWMGNFGLVEAWLREGFDPELDILPGVRAGVSHLGEAPKSLKYFTPIIQKMNRERLNPLPEFTDRRPTHGAGNPKQSYKLQALRELEERDARAADV